MNTEATRLQPIFGLNNKPIAQNLNNNKSLGDKEAATNRRTQELAHPDNKMNSFKLKMNKSYHSSLG